MPLGPGGPHLLHYHSVRKVSDLIFFFENLVDFNETRHDEATLNLHTHTWIISRLTIASVYGKQHLSEVLFSVLVESSCKENYGFRVVPVHPVSPVIMVFIKLGSLFVEFSISSES